MVPVRVTTGEVKGVAARGFGRSAILLLRLGTGAVFVFAGCLKLRAPEIFADDIAAFRILPPALDNLLALGLPPFEILLGLLLFTGWRRRTISFCAALTSGIFLIALCSAWVRGLRVDCGCFGSGGGEPRLWVAVARDLLLFAVTTALYLDARPDRTSQLFTRHRADVSTV